MLGRIKTLISDMRRLSLDKPAAQLNYKLITAFIIFSVVPLMVINYFSFEYSEAVIVRNAQETHQSNAKVTAQQVDNYVRSLTAQLRSLADNSSFHTQDLQGMNRLLSYFIDYNENFELAWVVDSQGQLIARAPGREQISLLDREYLQDTLRYGMPAVSGALIAKTGQHPIIVICVPINNENGQIIGALGGNINFRVLEKMIKPQEIHSGSQIFLTDQRGIILWHTREELVNGQYDASRLSIVQQLLSGRAAGTNRFVWEDEEYLGGFARIATTGWGVFVIQPYAAANKVLAAFRHRSALSLIVALIFSGILAVLLSYRIVISEKKIEEDIRRGEKLAVVGQFAAGMAHEVRNPLTTASGFLQLIKNDFPAGTKHNNYLDIALGEIDRVNEILRDFLALTKPQPPRLVAVELNELISQILLFVDNQAFVQGCKIKTDLGQGLPLVQADPNQLRQVFLNLIRNALESMPDGGVLAILTRLKPESKKVELVFQDTGSGIEPQNLEHIFEPFFTTKEGGTGLGLPISHRIIASHGGDMRVQSSPNGTAFIISLPVYEEPDIRPTQSSGSAPAGL